MRRQTNISDEFITRIPHFWSPYQYPKMIISFHSTFNLLPSLRKQYNIMQQITEDKGRDNCYWHGIQRNRTEIKSSISTNYSGLIRFKQFRLPILGYLGSSLSNRDNHNSILLNNLPSIQIIIINMQTSVAVWCI
jgi:hypothetical protein